MNLNDTLFSNYNPEIFPRVPIQILQDGQVVTLNIPDRLVTYFKRQNYSKLSCWQLRQILHERRITFRVQKKDEMIKILKNWDLMYLPNSSNTDQ